MAPQGEPKIVGAIGSAIGIRSQHERYRCSGCNARGSTAPIPIAVPRRLVGRTRLALQQFRLRMDNITSGTVMRTAHQDQDSLSHRFEAGHMVRFSTMSRYRNAAKGDYEVLAQLPARDGEFQYRIKSNCETHQRVAGEDELEAG